MKARLLHADRDFDPSPDMPVNELALVQDLALDTLFRAMAGDDKFLYEVARKAVLAGLRNDPATIRYRQAVLQDALRNPEAIATLYAIAGEAIENKRKHWLGIFGHHPGAVLLGSIGLLEMFMGMLQRLRGIAREQTDNFASEGFTALFTMLEQELTDEYFDEARRHLEELRFQRGVRMSAELGEGNQGNNYILLMPPPARHWWAHLAGQTPPAYTFRISEQDEAGAGVLEGMRDRGIAPAAYALAQSADHILGFFQALRTELAFYIGALNLHRRLAEKGEPICFPVPLSAGERRLRCEGLYDVSLTLHTEQRLVGNAVDACGKNLVLITGANQGGKSTLLRGLGLAQIMMHCGLFVGAESFSGELCTGLFTHYKREEDTGLEMGKLDEELRRMSAIADVITPDSVLFCNESFAATNEREGSEIARQIVGALLERRVKVFFVTHLHEFARGFADGPATDVLFLRAERHPDGTRSFRIVPGEPLETSYGADLYRRIFPEGR